MSQEESFEKQIGDVKVDVTWTEEFGFTISVLNMKDSEEGYIISANDDRISISRQSWNQKGGEEPCLGQHHVDDALSHTFSDFLSTPEGQRKIVDDYYASLSL